MQYRVLRGSTAVAALDDNARAAEWRDVLETSRSATVYEAPAFSRAWWRVYGSGHELAVVEATGANGALVGQFLLVRPGRPTGRWAPLGLQQNEYPAALSRDDDPAITAGLLRTAQAALKIPHLRFLFLPPGTPVDVYRIAGTSHLRAHPRPLYRFRDKTTAGKRTRGKLASLRRLGARICVLRRTSDIGEPLRQFVPMHDLRQEELGNGRPFHRDPRKTSFLLALAEEAGLLHFAAIFIEQRLIAGLVAVQNGSHLVLGQLAHAKDLEKLSPMSCLIHSLPDLYSGSDVDTLDLTPGGAYKDRFATAHDTAYALDVAWSPLRAIALVGRRELGPGIRRVERHLRHLFSGSADRRPGPTVLDPPPTGSAVHRSKDLV